MRRKRISALVPDDGIQYFKIDTIDDAEEAAKNHAVDCSPASEGGKKDGPKTSTATTNIEAPKADMAQTAEHQPKGPKVGGSNPGVPPFSRQR